ncbi:unnamed protein product [Brassicogethes aeneus]|uniref:Nuclear pore complex protein n=1 Tax=Brassicogethes aeneus TaxID=1431903 RepID=A0A9P0FJ89_BRAAE|nr:unnamed protein product [Brassicogethes aeneus]
MDNNLDRSVRLLEDALSTSGRGLFKTNTSKKRKDTVNNMEISLTLHPYELRKLMEGTMAFDDTMESILQDKSIRGSVIQADLPWNNALDSLYTEFFEVLQSHSGGHDILEVVSDLGRCTSDALKIVEGLKSKVSVSSLDTEKWLENERNTWRLIFILYQDRLFSQNAMDDDDAHIQYFGKSEKLCVQSLFKRDSLVRESQLVIDWLECNESDRDDEVLHFSDSTTGWENTLHQLHSASTIAFGASREIVDKMDPDAPNYQRKPLHDLDVEDEKRLSRRIFREIRCGKLEEAQRLCQQCGHSWKAAIFEGWRLYHNPNIKENGAQDADIEVDDGYEEMPAAENEEIEGNLNRDIWKAMAMKFCKQDWLEMFDRAAIGVFCGYVEPILPVCKTWEDNLWAYMKSIVDIRVESEIRDCCVRNDSYIPLSDEYWAQRMSLNDVFVSLDSSKNVKVREESRKPEHIIQKYIILDEIPKLINQLEDWIEESNLDTQFLRFAAHLVLFLEQIGQTHHSVEKILEAYIRRLTLMKETQLIAYYVSKLSPSNQVQIYALYLENIVENEERKKALMYAEDSCLDVLSITKQVVENIRNKPHEVEGSGNLQHKITDIDTFKVGALDWVLFYETQKVEALYQSNALIFTFLTLGKIDAAQLAYNKIPSDYVEKIVSESGGEGEIGQVVKEHLSYKAYLNACDAFNEWFMQCKNKPNAPEDLPETAQFTEKVAQQHRVAQYKAEVERWKLTTNHLAKTAKTMLYNVLLFPEGWLIGAKDAEYLRSSCIPEIVLLLYTVLFESGQHEECVQLADILASEKYGLYKVYSKEKLGEILVKLCESSVELLNSKKDPWGNEVSA